MSKSSPVQEAPLAVKVSSRHQISLPSAARRQLGIEAGDRLLVDVQDGILILIPSAFFDEGPLESVGNVQPGLLTGAQIVKNVVRRCS
ncbi:MAG: AbrB/MazE/SpoVT family DNA-binding domain-containing protein [Caldilineaceae bacterium]|nr:AbrB/MazE/SpoVT family DNA-binding domain-containing protein [Caldilineaceae bacterium]